MATKKAVLPSKKPPPPPKTRPGPGQAPYGPQGKVPARASGERYATLPPGMLSTGRPLPNTYTRVTAPAPAPAPIIRDMAVPPAPTPARPQPVGPKSLPPSDAPVQYRRGMETFEPQVIQPMYEPEMPIPEPIYDASILRTTSGFKRGGFVKKADGVAKRGKTKGRYI